MATKYEKINFEEIEVNEGEDVIVEEAINHEEDNTKVVSELSEKETDKIQDSMKAMTDEEQIVGLKVVSSEKLWVELRRRNAIYQDKIESFNSIMGVSLNTINPIPEASWIGMVDRYTDIENRFNEIAKLMGV